MEFQELIQQRRSIRGFTSQPVEEGKLQKILEAVNEAPSAGNRQAYEVYVVRKPGDRAALAAAAAEPCARCAACTAVCPTGVPIHRLAAMVTGIAAAAGRPAA